MNAFKQKKGDLKLKAEMDEIGWKLREFTVLEGEDEDLAFDRKLQL